MLPESATNAKLTSGDILIVRGALNNALLPIPFVDPAAVELPPPTKTLTDPVDMIILRIRLFALSTIRAIFMSDDIVTL